MSDPGEQMIGPKLDEKVLNDELLAPEPKPEPDEPRRNSKDNLIQKIIQVCTEKNLQLEESNSKLRRMTKAQLTNLLAEKIEKAVHNSMAEQVGAPPRVTERRDCAGSVTDGPQHRCRVRGKVCQCVSKTTGVRNRRFPSQSQRAPGRRIN